MTWHEGHHDDEQEGMRRALGLAADQVPEPDLAQTTWRQGRRVRRRRHLATAVGGVAAVAVLAAGWAAVQERPDAAPAARSHAEPTPVLRERPPQHLEIDGQGPPAWEQGVRLWARLETACLERQGLDAWLTEDGMGVEVRRPDTAGLPGRDEARRWCDETMVLVMPALALEERGSVQAREEAAARKAAEEASGTGVAQTSAPLAEARTDSILAIGSLDHLHLAYSRTATCLSHNGLPAEQPPTAAEFEEQLTTINPARFFAGEPFLPPWHPYAAALAQDGPDDEAVGTALEVCPVERYLLGPGPEGDERTDPGPTP